jgi:hypothetical protein
MLAIELVGKFTYTYIGVNDATCIIGNFNNIIVDFNNSCVSATVLPCLSHSKLIFIA